MSDISQVFAEIVRNLDSLSSRVAKFETWEPSSGFQDTGAHAYRTTFVNIPTGAYSQIPFDGELWDTDTINSGGTFTIPADGKYLFHTGLITAGVTGTSLLRIYKSATEYIYTDQRGTYQGLQLAGIMDCDEGDTVIVEFNPPINLNVLGSTNVYQSFFQVQRVG